MQRAGRDLDSVHFRHGEVEQLKLQMMMFEQHKRVGAVVDAPAMMAGFSVEVGESFADFGIVVDQQDFGSPGSGSRPIWAQIASFPIGQLLDQQGFNGAIGVFSSMLSPEARPRLGRGRWSWGALGPNDVRGGGRQPIQQHAESAVDAVHILGGDARCSDSTAVGAIRSTVGFAWWP